MIQRCEHLGFTFEPGEAIGILRKGFRQYLDRDIAIQLRIARAIHFAHSARAGLVRVYIDRLLETFDPFLDGLFGALVPIVSAF